MAPKIRQSGDSLHRRFRRKEMNIGDELYYNNIYQPSYRNSGRATKPNRRMNGRSMGVCNSCSRRGHRR